MDEIAEGEDDEDFDDEDDDEEDMDVIDVDAEILESTKGFGKESVASSKASPTPAMKQTENDSVFDDEEEDEGDFEDMSDEEVDEMLREVFAELKGKNKGLTMKAFKKWEDIEEMLSAKIIDAATIDSLAEKVGVKKGSDIAYEQFKALVELLDDFAGEDDDSEEMSASDERMGDDEERVEIDEDEVGGDGSGEDEEMTPEEIEEMTRDLFDTLKGNKKTLSVKTFLSWDNIQDQEILDDETINILLEEVGANKNRKGDLTYKQFSDLIQLLEETVDALGDGEGVDTIMEDEDESAESVSATLEEREEIDAEISLERNERNVLDGIDDEGVDSIAKQIYEDLRGESDSLSVQDFLKWEDVSELVDQGIVQLSTLNLLIAEVGGAKTQTLSFDQFWQLVNLLEEASDAAADKVAASMGDDDVDDSELDSSPEELEKAAKEIFDDLKNPKTNTVNAKKLKNWAGIKEVLDSGELSKGALNSAIKEVGAERTNELNFEQFKQLMDLLEASMDEEDGEVQEYVAPVSNVSGKGFAPVTKAAPVVAAAAVVAAPVKAAAVPVKAEKESEAAAISRELYEELVGKDKSLSVSALREWEDLKEMIEDGSLKRSTLEKALVKIGSLESGDVSLKQFMQLIDIIQGSVDDSNLKYEFEDDAKDEGFETSKKSTVLSSEDEEEAENWGDDESGGDFVELTEEEAAREAFDELVVGGASTISLVDFLQWEDVQELLEFGALSKDDLATAIENAGVSLEKDGITFEKVKL